MVAKALTEGRASAKREATPKIDVLPYMIVVVERVAEERVERGEDEEGM